MAEKSMMKCDNRETKQNLNCCIFSALGVLLLFAVIWGGAWLLYGEERTFLLGDALVQYVHFIKLFLRHLIRGESFDYSFEVGMGMPTRAIYAYYSLSPFNLVFLFVKDINKAGICLTALKMMMSGAMFSLLLRKTWKTDYLVTVLCSAAYALCGYAMIFYYGYVLQDCLYLMPLLITFLIRFTELGRWRGLSTVYALSFIIQFYCGYIMGVFSVIVLIAILWKKYGKNIAEWKHYIVVFLWSVFVAVLLSAPVTLPAAMELFGHMGKDATEMDGLNLMPWEFLGAFYPGQSEDVYNHFPAVYAGMPMIVLTIHFFINPRNDKRLKSSMSIPLIFLLVCTFFAPAYLMMHGFDAPDGYYYRFSWQWSLWLAYISAGELHRIKPEKSKIRIVAIAAGAAVGYFILYLLQRGFSDEKHQMLSGPKGLICAVMLGVYSLCLILWEKNRVYRRLFAIALAAELIWNGNMVQLFLTNNTTGSREYYRIWQEQAESCMQYIETKEKGNTGTFYRVKNSNCLCDNISMLYGYHGLGYFSTIEHEAVRNTLGKLGYAVSARVVEDYGSTPFTRMIFAQKYLLECEFWRGEQRGYYKLGKNEMVLPVAFMVSDELEDLHLTSYNPFENQNRLAGAMMGEESNVYQMYAGGYVMDAEGVEMAAAQEGFRLHRLGGEGETGEVLYTFEPEKEDGLYAYVSMAGESGLGSSPVVYSSSDLGGMLNFSQLYMPHIISVPAETDGKAYLHILMTDNCEDTIEYECIYGAYENPAEEERVFQILRKGQMDVREASEGVVRGMVTVAADKTLLFTSIPYEKGWEVYVDGVKTQPTAVLDGAFLAVNLEPGTHEVLLQFVNPVVGWGYMTGIVGIVLLMIDTIRGIVKKILAPSEQR